MEYANPAKRLEMLTYGPSANDITMMNIRSISVNVFGLLAIATGLFLAGAWFYKRSNREEPASAPTSANIDPSPSATSLRSNAPSIPQPIGSEKLSCKFTGWARDGNKIVQEYSYRGQGLDHRAIVELMVEKGALGALRFVHIWLSPDIDSEGRGEILLSDEASSETPGWLPTRIGAAANNMTLLNVEEREGADAVWRMFIAGRDLEFSLRLNGEQLVALPMPNNPGVQVHYEAILASI